MPAKNEARLGFLIRENKRIAAKLGLLEQLVADMLTREQIFLRRENSKLIIEITRMNAQRATQ